MDSNPTNYHASEKKRIFLFILRLLVVWLIILQITAFISLNFLDLEKPHTWPQKPLKNFLYWARWDTGWYASIADHGYYLKEGNSDVAFFPLYPLLMKLLNIIFGLDVMWAGFFISVTSFIVALYYLYKLILLDLDENQTKRSLIYLLILPASFFFISVYTESLFLLEVVLSFYLARKNKWFLAGIFGFLASLTRLPGIILFPVLLIEYLSQKNYKLRNIKPDISNLLIIPLGLLSFMFYLWYKFNDAFLFIHNQTTFLRNFTWPYKVIKGYLHTIFINPSEIEKSLYWILVIDLAILIIYTVLTVISFKKLRLSYALFMLLGLLILIFTGTLSGMSRYTLPLFPAIIILGLINNKILRVGILTISALTLIFLVIRFVNWYWVG